MVGPILGDADAWVVEIGAGSGVGDEGPPGDDQQEADRDIMPNSGEQSDQDQEKVSQSDLAERILKGEIGLGLDRKSVV